MIVYLLRHGQAEQYASSDSLRELTPLGRSDIGVTAQSFLATKRVIDRCFASPFIRTQQTAEIFSLETSMPCRVESEDRLRPENTAFSVLHFLESLKEENVLLIGHNPLLSELFDLLTTGKNGSSIKLMSAGELCGISFDILGLGTGQEVLDILPANQ